MRPPKVEHGIYNTRISFRWSSSIKPFIVLILLCLLLFYFLLNTQRPERINEWIGASICAIVWLFAFYVCLAYVANKTDVLVDSNCISISHSPFPWQGNLRVVHSDKHSIRIKTIETEQIDYGAVAKSYTFEVILVDYKNEYTLLKCADFEFAEKLASELRDAIVRNRKE